MTDEAIAKVNMIVLEIYDVVVLGMDWLFNHRVSMDGFAKKIVLSK